MFDETVVQNLGVFYVISQIFAFLAFLCDIVAIQQRKKANLLKLDTAAAFFSTMHYLFLGAWAGVVSKTITTARNGLAAYEATKNRTSKLLPAIFIILYIVLGAFAVDSVFAIIPILVPSIYAVAIYLSDVRVVRYTSVFTNILWLIYNIHVSSVVGIISMTILIINGLIAIYRYRRKDKKKPRAKSQKSTS